MKIVYVENVRVPSERAHAYQIVQTCTWLAQMGHDVTLVNPDRAHGQDVFAWYGLRRHIFKHVLIKAWDPLSGSFPFKALAYALQRRAFTRALRAWAKNINADVWYTRDAAMIDALSGVVDGPWVLESHDTPDASVSRWKRIKSRVAYHVAISNGMGERLKQLGVPSDQILVAPDGYDPDEFAHLPTRSEARRLLGLPQDAFIVLYAGSFYAWKGVELAVMNWDKAPDNVHLLMIGGPNGDRERLAQLVPSAARSRVHVLPARPRRQAIPVYPAGDIGLLTSSPDHDIARHYTSPLKQFEYLATGLPVLASDVPSSHDILTSQVARFFTPTAEGFLSALTDVARDAEWRSRAESLARQTVAPYSWEARTRSIVDWLSAKGILN